MDMQTQWSTASLSTTEAEHVALSTLMRDAICFVDLIQEIQDFGIKLPHASAPKVTCPAFEGNVGVLELANAMLISFAQEPSTCQFSCIPSANMCLARQHSLRKSELNTNVLTCLPKPWVMMLSSVCKVRSADGKTLRGSVMNTRFMMEFTNSRCACLNSNKILDLISSPKLTSLQKLTILV